MAIEEPRWKVGELARATGLTVRTLHDYVEAAVHRWSASGRGCTNGRRWLRAQYGPPPAVQAYLERARAARQGWGTS
jgi:hypothetical protein